MDNSYKTQFAGPKVVNRKWFVVDAEGETLGRLATKIAHVLRGKHRPYYSPNFDTGDYVIVLNGNKVNLSGNKWNDKVYLHHTGYPGGQRAIIAKSLNQRHYNALIENAVRGMLPKNRMGRAQFKKLFVYEGSEHPHTAQKPEVLNLKSK